MNHFEFYFLSGEPSERVGEGLDRTLHVALEDDLEFLDLARREPLAQIFQRDAAGLGEFAFTLFAATILGDLARFRFLYHRGKHGAGFGNGGEAKNFDRRRRPRLAQTLADRVLHRAYPSVRGTADES